MRAFFITVLGSLAISAEAADYAKEIDPILVKYCFGCHDSLTTKGDFDMESLDPAMPDSATAQHWIEIMDDLNASEMPPPDEDLQPTAEERRMVADWIADKIRQVYAEAQSTGGRALMRRLNREEYANTVRDVLGVTFSPGQTPEDLLPPDGSIEGFTKVSRGLMLDPSLMDSYLRVAALTADRALRLGDPPVPTLRSRVTYKDLREDDRIRPKGRYFEETEHGFETWIGSFRGGFNTGDYLKHPYNEQLVPVPGRYMIRFRAGSQADESGELPLVEMTRNGTGRLFYGTIDAPMDQPKVIEIEADLDPAGDNTIGLRLLRGRNNSRISPIGRKQRLEVRELSENGADPREVAKARSRYLLEGFNENQIDPETVDSSGFQKLLVDWIEIEGPLYPQWPPASVDRILFRGVDESLHTEAYLREISQRLLPDLYRRPVSDEEIDAVVAVGMAEWDASDDFVTGVRGSLIAALCSPKFLLLAEPSPETELRELTPYELAARLSYFLWSSAPDETLKSLAEAGTLADQLPAQIDRMLSDAKSDSLVEGFAKQWLKADQFDRFSIDETIYRDYYADEWVGINEDLNREPIATFRHLLRDAGDLRDLLDSDYLIANRRLAAYYDLPTDGLSDDEWQRVSLPADHPRGGLLTMGAFHKWGSDGNRTKPVDRGKYILEVLFNRPPNPPPPNVDEIEPNVDGEKLSVRQRLEAHREIESCRSCHQNLDPYGLALENFNVVGKWRDVQDGEINHWHGEVPQIDPSGVLPDGTAFGDVHEFKAALLAQDERFFRGFAEKLFTYAFARLPEPSDRALIDATVAALQQEPTVQAAIHTLVTSQAFRTK